MTVAISEKPAQVGMGQIAMLTQRQTARAVLGSCIGLSLWHPRLKVASLAHIVLPSANGRTGVPGKFADTAIPYMIEELKKLGAPYHGLKAKLTGGANMFASSGPLQVGAQNAEAVRQHLASLSVPIDAEHVGGKHGRRITFDSTTGMVTIEIVGQPDATI